MEAVDCVSQRSESVALLLLLFLLSLWRLGSHYTAHTEREVRSEGAGPGLQVCGLECEFSSLPFFFNVIFCLVPTFCLL